LSGLQRHKESLEARLKEVEVNEALQMSNSVNSKTVEKLTTASRPRIDVSNGVYSAIRAIPLFASRQQGARYLLNVEK
jgi:hypothetical protein